MSRFGTSDPFYKAIQENESRERMQRILSLHIEYRCGHHDIAAPIIDHDPGDEDRG